MKIFKYLFIAAALMISLAVLSSCGETESASTDTEATAVAVSKVPYTGPERFVLEGIDGNVRNWSEFAGQPVVINFWATWCPPCRIEIPILKELYAEFKPKGMEIIGISFDMPGRSKHKVAPFIRENNIPWVTVFVNQDVAKEFDYQGSIPMTVFINAKGEETGRITGAQPHATFRKEFEKMFE
ncbi:MAG: TlpA family protein disulfide reductase [candidate division Zixibacteria bacterium]|nr:TlpA family protein disulfide reductase [candidate division Zixibacteria bacterium]